MIRKAKFAIAIIILSLFSPASLLISPPQHADAEVVIVLLDTVYVNGTLGNNSYTGSSPVFISGIIGPKKTIAAGIAVAGDSGTVNVAPGTYNEHGLHLSKEMNLIGTSALLTIIDGGAQGFVLEVSSAPYQRNTISGFTIRNGAPSGTDPGGGIYIYRNHIVTINDCAIVNNIKGAGASDFCPGMGGGICNDGGALYMNRCTVSGNTALNNGGGIYSQRQFGGDSGLVQMTNCTISGNSVTGERSAGGGVYVGNAATMKAVNVTIANNRALGLGGVGGGFCNGSSDSVYIKNSIVANNTAVSGSGNNGFDAYEGAAVFSLGNNIDSENSCYFNATTDQRNTNPLLGPLQNNGGFTSTHAISTNSPAFNRGSSTSDPDMPTTPLTDQRGIVRPQGTAFDIGAFELVYTLNTATGLGAATFTTNAGSLISLLPLSVVTCGTIPDVNFTYGFFSFTVAAVGIGGSATITITLPTNVPAGAQYWKCIGLSWVNCTSLLGSNDGDNILTLTITDGALGDADRLADGIIVDPGGVGIVTVAPTTTVVSTSTPSSSPTLPERPLMAPPRIIAKYLDVQPTAQANQPVTITANMANSGDTAGSYTATLKINGEVEQVKNGRVNGHAAIPIEFTVYRDKPGQYIADINGQQASFTIVGSQNSTDISKYIPITGFIFCLIGVLWVSVLLIQRRRSQYN